MARMMEDYQNSKKARLGNEIPQGDLKRKRTDEASASMSGKGTISQTCSFCGKRGHSEDVCWKKFGRCFGCGSPEHQIKDCLSSRSGKAKVQD